MQHLKGSIDSEPQQTNDILRFEIKLAKGYTNEVSKKATGRLLVALKLDTLHPLKLNYGDEVLIPSKHLPVEPPYNPAEFDFRAWLASKNIYQQSFIRQDQVIKLNENRGNPVIKYALAVRQRQVDIYRKLIKDDEAFAVASTLILGYRADLSKETLSAYSRTGTIHALSVSGMHVGIIYILLNWLLVYFDKNALLKLFKLLLICTLIWYYSLLTGFSPSVLRSAIMLTVFILAKQFKRTTNNYNILAFTAFCLLVYNPFLIWDVGFQLSFLAVFGLSYFQPKIYKWFQIKNKWLDKLWSAIALSLAAQITTLPLSVYYFHQFPVYFIISNLFILFPITLLMYAGISILLLKVYFLAPAFEWLVVFTNNGLKWIANLPFSGITAIWINRYQVLLLSLFIIMLTIGLAYNRKKYLMTAMAILLGLQLTFSYDKIKAIQQKQIIFFSLRKNFAAAFIYGKESILVSDLELDDKSFDFFVKPALEQKQVKTINLVKWQDDVIMKNFSKKDKQIIFNNYSLLLMDESFSYKKLVDKPKFDMVWLHNNPKQIIENIDKEIDFSMLIIDSSNHDYSLSKFQEQLATMKIDHHILKKNNSYLVDLKHKTNE